MLATCVAASKNAPAPVALFTHFRLMITHRLLPALTLSALLPMLAAPTASAAHIEQRNEVTYRRGPYNLALYYRHNETYRNGAAIHFAHGRQHDVLALTPLADHARVDRETDADYVDYMLNHRARTEPTMEYYAPYTARTAWTLFRTIDWTHVHHEQTYDVMASKNVPWERKKEFTDRTVRYYLEKADVARSPAPLDVTMRRAGAMMKPYFTYFRNYYPESSKFFFAAHWWHPATYEAQMLGGNGPEQDRLVDAVQKLMYREALVHRPQRMLLSREMMPRYSKLSPESANIFDNLHMLHGFAYDILAYEGWTDEEKRRELYRVIKAMSYQPGDEKLAAKFRTPYPKVDPTRYEPWMRAAGGEMGRIMMEMMNEMMPMMMPDGMSPARKAKVMAQFKMKMMPGMQRGEIEGSLHDAMMKLMPDMKMMPGSLEPGETAQGMVATMLAGWRKKHGGMPDIAATYVQANPQEPPLRAKH